MKNIIYLVLFSGFVLTFWACEKFPDGGSKQKAENNLTNIWQIDAYYVDGTDKTSELLISNFEETFADDGTYTRIYKDGNGAEVSQIGTWTLDTDNNEVKFNGGGAMDLTSTITGVSTSVYSIYTLKKKHFTYGFDSGGNEHEFRMIPKE